MTGAMLSDLTFTFTPGADAFETFFGGLERRAAVAFDSWACPVAVPVKRRGLTGKAYRSARRRYARQMRAYRRGEIPPQRVRTYIPNALVTDMRATNGEVRIEFTAA